MKKIIRILPFYEILRLVFILLFPPEEKLALMPVSWYAAVPLLMLVPLLAWLMYAEKEYLDLTKKLYCLTKLLQTVGLTVFTISNIVMLKTLALINDVKSLKIIVFSLVIILIDGILSVIVLKMGGEVCK
ncbi:MAG: hypothetical protein J6T84_00320 [Spirochaetaceae bacterium]|nr:hypothetical protein [Spirochaetaceae bacterium]